MQDYGPNRPSAFHSLRVQLVEIFHLFTSNPSVLTFCWLCAGNFRPFSLQKPPRLFLIAGELTVRWRAVSCSGCVFHPKWRHGALSIRKPLIITVAPLIISSTTTDFHVTFTLTNRYSDGHKGRSVDGMVGFSPVVLQIITWFFGDQWLDGSANYLLISESSTSLLCLNGWGVDRWVNCDRACKCLGALCACLPSCH